MLIEDIEFSGLENKSREGRWGEGIRLLDRHLFLDTEHGLWIKTWSQEYTRNMKLCRGSTYEFLQDDGSNNSIHGIDINFFNSKNSVALQDIIYDKDSVIRGYVTRDGIVPDDIPAEFTESNAQRMFDLGWVMSDYCTMNLVLVDGKMSFIDYDTHFTSLADIDIAFEIEFGCLRSHVDPLFRSMVLSAVEHL